MEIKMHKDVDDACFGKQFKQIGQCNHCWIKDSCQVAFKNKYYLDKE